MFGGRKLLSRRVEPGETLEAESMKRFEREQEDKAAKAPARRPPVAGGAVGAVGMIIALSISSSVVDSSPFSTSGALTLANTPEEKRDFVFKRLMQWGMSMVLIAPPIAWLVFVVSGWL
jgi:hypothetical protein